MSCCRRGRRACCSTASTRKPDIGFVPDALARILFDLLALSPSARLIVAFSGGLDSHVLLHALVALRARYPLDLAAVHVDHGLQPTAGAWSRHCVRICASLGVACTVESVRVEAGAHGLEAAARAARYDALGRHMAPGRVLLTAHHRDDQAETLLLQLLRGAGVRGLAAMPASTSFRGGRLVRPLLPFSRQALQVYARAHDLQWVEDASNEDRRFARNFIRHEIMPRLTQRWPAAAGKLVRAAENAAEAAAVLDETARADLEAAGQGDGSLRISTLCRLSGARRRNLLRHWIAAHTGRVPGGLHLQEVERRLLTPPKTGHAAIRWPGVELRRYRDLLYAFAPLPPIAPALDLPWDLSAPLEAAGWRLRAQAVVGVGLSQQRLAGRGLRVRLRRGGEICELVDRGHHRKVKKLLQESGMPPWRRERLPLLYADGALAAVGAAWVCAPFAARQDEAAWQLSIEWL